MKVPVVAQPPSLNTAPAPALDPNVAAVPAMGMRQLGQGMHQTGDLMANIAAKRKTRQDTIMAANLMNEFDAELGGLEAEMENLQGSAALGVSKEYGTRVAELKGKYASRFQSNTAVAEMLGHRFDSRINDGISRISRHEFDQERQAAADAYTNEMNMSMSGVVRMGDPVALDAEIARLDGVVTGLGLPEERGAAIRRETRKKMTGAWLDHFCSSDPAKAMTQAQTWFDAGVIDGDTYAAAQSRAKTTADDAIKGGAYDQLRADYGDDFDGMQQFLSTKEGREKLGVDYGQARELMRDIQWDQEEKAKQVEINLAKASLEKAKVYQDGIIEAASSPGQLKIIKAKIESDLSLQAGHREILLKQIDGAGKIDISAALDMIRKGSVKETDLDALAASLDDEQDRARIKAEWKALYGPDKETFAEVEKMYGQINGTGKDRKFASPTAVFMADFKVICQDEGLHGPQIMERARGLLSKKDEPWPKPNYIPWKRMERSGEAGLDRKSPAAKKPNDPQAEVNDIPESIRNQIEQEIRSSRPDVQSVTPEMIRKVYEANKEKFDAES